MSRLNYCDFLPRHTKGYLWIAFLVAVFMLMGLSENGVSVFPNPLSPQGFASTPYEPISSASPAPQDSNHQEFFSDEKSKEKTGVDETTFGTSIGLDPKDVVILVKTGATSIWRRMPAHMSTTLGNPRLTPNVLYYSDSEDNINGNFVIDVLANVSASLKASPDFTLYNKASEVANDNLYLESGSMEGDHYLPGGWRLDKYKFLPMFQHAAINMPGKKWYVYMEDDNYFFWETLYAWLSTLDHTTPIMVGSPAFRLGEDFAHGGSGFAISGAALRRTFGADRKLADKWEDYAKEQCCGDQVLSHVLRDMGVERYTGLDGGSWAALQALPTWRIGFGRWNWCSPIMNIHKVHQSDISRLFVFERDFKAKTNGTSRLRYHNIFTAFAKLKMNVAQRSEWDNYASAKSFSSSTDEDVKHGGEVKSTLTANQLATKPWYSHDACKKACEKWEECLTWRYADDSCSLDHTAAMGQRIDAGIRMESGWMIDRIASLEDIECQALDF